jgi:uncharacterized membrane protein (UPF0136 family)
MATISDLIGRIKASQAQIASSLAQGNAPNWDAYQRLVGRHEGLQEALDILDNMMKEHDEDE